jgi:hypothetical protein
MMTISQFADTVSDAPRWVMDRFAATDMATEYRRRGASSTAELTGSAGGWTNGLPWDAAQISEYSGGMRPGAGCSCR